MKIRYIFLFVTLIFSSVSAQVGVNTNAPHASAMLDIVSENKGLLPPRLTSDAMVQDPAEGLVIYDESDDCLNVFDGNDWVNLCASGTTAGGGGTGGGFSGSVSNGNGMFPWANTIAFQDFSTNNGQYTLAISEDNDVYAFGQTDLRRLVEGFRASDDASVSNTSFTTLAGLGSNTDPVYAPTKFDDPALNGKTVKARSYTETFLFLNSDGDLYGFGRNLQLLFPSNVVNRYYQKNQIIDLPFLNPGEKVRDFSFSVGRLIIITTEGRLFLRTEGSSSVGRLGALITSGNWEELAQPAGALPSFEYMEFLSSYENDQSTFRAIYVSGNDGEVYGMGRESSSANRTFGIPTLLAGYDDPSNSLGVHRINFNLAAGETITEVNVSDALVTALSSIGKVYVWGLAPSTVMPIVPGSGTLTGIHYIDPVELELPAGETAFRDVHHFFSRTTGVIVVGESGKLYMYGDLDAIPTLSFLELKDYKSEYTQILSWNGVDVARIQRLDQDALMALDTSGQIWFSGPHDEEYFASPSLRDVSFPTVDADDVVPMTNPLVIPIPLFDEAFTEFN